MHKDNFEITPTTPEQGDGDTGIDPADFVEPDLTDPISDPISEPTSEPISDPIPATRTILLKVSCTGSGCCGKSGSVTTKYAVIHIESDPDNSGKWIVTKASPMKGNYIALMKKYGTWKGAVYHMGLHDDPAFIQQLRDKGCWKDGCKAIG